MMSSGIYIVVQTLIVHDPKCFLVESNKVHVIRLHLDIHVDEQLLRQFAHLEHVPRLILPPVDSVSPKTAKSLKSPTIVCQQHVRSESFLVEFNIL